MPAPRNREWMTSPTAQDSDELGVQVLSIALIGPEEHRRNAVAKAIARSQIGMTQEFRSYPAAGEVSRLLESNYDIIVVELDSNPEHALQLVEYLWTTSSVPVMVYSVRADPEMLVRCMRAGAREFLTVPIASEMIAEALIRAAARRPAAPSLKKVSGKIFLFLGSKGGSGVTTIAINFAVALAQESGQKALLIDFGFPIGDAALSLGIKPHFSTAHALENSDRLDSSFISKLLSAHDSGLFVLSAPDQYAATQPSPESVERLINIVRQDFDYVVVDAGSSFGPALKSLLDASTAVYLVTQVGISELRNSNRLISQFFKAGRPKLEVVLNHFSERLLGIDEHHIRKALTVPIDWKIPADRDSAVRAQNTAQPLVLQDSPISRVVRGMARTACGLPKVPQRKRVRWFR